MENFEASFESLRTYKCPDWFRNAKFGIWSHWGPQSVPMCGDWYARNMYIQGSEQYNYHIRHYGHPSKFGYKDICALWKAEKFNPDELMELYVKAGAKYFVAQAMHHDNFFNYESKVNPFNSAKIGPMKDICSMWKAAADKYKLPFGLTEHLGASFSWWKVNKYHDTYGPFAGVPYDGNDPKYAALYHKNYEHVSEELATDITPWYTSNKEFLNYWTSAMEELIEKFEPELLYSDGSLPFGEHWISKDEHTQHSNADYEKGLKVVANLYNTSIRKHGNNQAVYTQKDRRAEIYEVGILYIEKSQLPDINPRPWHTDTCIGNWFYDAKQTFKKPSHIIEMLIDIVAKNGTMLLNVLQRPDGSIDEETRYILDELASWFPICGEAIYDTSPFRISGEGESKVEINGFTEVQVPWSTSDYRFTTKGNTVYVFMLKAPENRVTVIKSFLESERVKAVRLLGGENLAFTQAYGVMTVKLPENLPTKYTNCLAVEMV
jgi:alpha-L-fucosidase